MKKSIIRVSLLFTIICFFFSSNAFADMPLFDHSYDLLSSMHFATDGIPVPDYDGEISEWPEKLAKILNKKKKANEPLVTFYNDYQDMIEDPNYVFFMIAHENDNGGLCLIVHDEMYVFENETIADGIHTLIELLTNFESYQKDAREIGQELVISWFSTEFTNGEVVFINQSNYKECKKLLGI